MKSALFPTNATTQKGEVIFTRVLFYGNGAKKSFKKTSYCTSNGKYLSKSERDKLPPISET